MRPSLIAATAGLLVLATAGCGAGTGETASQHLGPTRTVTVIATSTSATAATSTQPSPAPTSSTGGSSVPETSTATQTTTLRTATITTPDSGGAGLATNTQTTGTAACVARDLAATALGPNSAPGTTVLGITLKNVTSASCHTYGWPGVGLVTSSGRLVSVLTTRSVHDVLGATPATAFVLAPGEMGSFRVTVHDAGGGSQADCTEFSRLQIIAPDDTAALEATIPDGPVQSCANVAVSAIEPGTSATGQ